MGLAMLTLVKGTALLNLTRAASRLHQGFDVQSNLRTTNEKRPLFYTIQVYLQIWIFSHAFSIQSDSQQLKQKFIQDETAGFRKIYHPER